MSDDMPLKEEMRGKMSLLSAFLYRKVNEKGIGLRELAEETGLSRRYLYLLISEKRKDIPKDDELEKISDALDLSDDDKEQVRDIVERERKAGKLIYDDKEPGPVVKPSGTFLPWYKNRSVIALMVVIFIAGLILGCCGSTTFIPFILEIMGMPEYHNSL